MSIRKTVTGILPLLIFLFFTGILYAQTETGAEFIVDTLLVFEDFFEDEEPIHLTLKFDIKNFSENKIQRRISAGRTHLPDK